MPTAPAESPETQLNETIRLLMTRTGRRQVDVAAALGITRASLSQRLLNKSSWRLNHVATVADFFGLSTCELISGYAAIAQADRLPPASDTEGQTRI